MSTSGETGGRRGEAGKRGSDVRSDCWIGVELHPAAGGARRFCEGLMQEGLLCKETHTHTIRFAPPLVVQKADLEWAMERIARVLG